jgi:hypothetical protein
MSLPARTRFIACVLSVPFFQSAFAQQPKVLAPHRPIPPLVEHPKKWYRPAVLRSVAGGMWMIDANFKSTIYLRNNVETDPITATPILWLSNGQKYVLNEVKLDPAGVAVINVNQALADKSIASWATLNGYLEVQYTWPWDALCATVWNVDAGHSLIFTSGLAPSSLAPKPGAISASPQSQIVQGMWWKQELNVTGFIALSNTSSAPVQAIVQVSDTEGNLIANHSVTVSPHGTKLVNMPELQSSGTTAGGVRISYTGPPKSLIAVGALEDQAVGYSAMMPFKTPPTASAKTSTESYAILGLMTGAADPMMSFPAGTTFTPYSMVRNISDQPIHATPTLWWMEGSAPKSAALHSILISPGQTQNLDVPSMLVSAGLKNFNGSVNLVLDLQGPPRSLLMANGSVDQKNTYVFGVVASGIGEGMGRSIAYWSTTNGDDTMVSLWNPADEAQDFTLTVFFTGGHYKYPIHLGPRASNTFNMSEIVHSQIPDAEGNIIPSSIHEGSARISGQHGLPEHILLAMDASSYNVVKATCGFICLPCEAIADDGDIDAPPVNMGVGGTDTVKFMVQLQNGDQADYTNLTTWSTSDTSIASVQSAGVIQGVAVGDFTTYANGPDENTGAECCTYDGECTCPSEPLVGSGGGTVQVPTSLSVLSVTVLPNGQGLNYGCSGLANYGIMVDIKYQVLDQNGNPIASANMTPYEQGVGFSGSPYSGNIGPTGFTNSTLTTAADGTFHDVPFGVCANGAFSSATNTQNITMVMPDGSTPAVRSQTFTATGKTAGHGTLNNAITSPGAGSDISATR